MDNKIRAAIERYKTDAYLTNADLVLKYTDMSRLSDAYVALMTNEKTPIIDETITLDPAHADLRGEYSDISLLLASSDTLKPRPELEFGKRYRIRIEEVA